MRVVVAPSALAVALAVTFSLAAASLTCGCNRSASLEPEALAAAEQTWQHAALGTYRLRMNVSGDRIQAGDFVAEVRDGVVTSLSRNGEAVATRDRFYSVEGLFALLRDELHMAKQPAHYWGAPADARVVLRASFDDERGFVRRYLRAVSGTDQNIALRIDAVEPLP